MKIRAGDTVLVISGKDKGKTGKVVRILPNKNHIVVEGINLRVKYVKKTEQKAGQKITFEASMPSSKVMALDPKTKKPTRLGYKIDPKTGRKERVALVSGTVITANAVVKTDKKAAAKTEKVVDKKPHPSAGADVAKKKVEESMAEEKGEGKKGGPFWKRMGFGKTGGGPIQEDSTHKSVEPDHPSAPVVHKTAGRGK